MAPATRNDGKVALVTGAAAGIGWAIARRLAATGARLVIADLDGERAKSRAAELGPQHAALAVDIGDTEAGRRMIADCTETFGRLDILVNNAGRTTNSGHGLVEQPPEIFAAIMAVNLEGALAAADEAARLMARQGGGSIVNIASGAAFRAIPFRSAYSASKAGLVASSRRLAEEWRAHGVRVNVVAPGFIRTELLDDLISQGKLDPSRAVAKIPLGRMGAPEEIAEAVAFMGSDAARGITGAVLSVDGGSQAFGGSGPASGPESVSAPPPASGQPAHVFVGGENEFVQAFRAHWAQARTRAAFISPTQPDREIGELLHIPAALDDEHGLRQALLSVRERHGRIDGIVYAGPGFRRETEPPSPSIRACTASLHRLARAAGPLLLAQGGGSFVNLIRSVPEASHDVAAAGAVAALEMLSRTLACEWGPVGVRVNTVAVSDGSRGVAEAATFLLSPAASYVNGAMLTVGPAVSSGREES